MESDKSLVVKDFDANQIELIKRTIAVGCSNDELSMFLHQAQRTGLDPLSRQIYIIKRKSRDQQGNWIEKAVIQTSIDGFRLVADRTGRYAPGEEKFEYGKDGNVTAAHVSVKKLAGGVWHEVWASAHWDEYAQMTKEGKPTSMWSKLPRVMLAKCAESKGLRKAFPAELSGLYTADEMAQSEKEPAAPPRTIFPEPEPKDWKDDKGKLLVEAEAPGTPRGEHPVDKLSDLSEEHKRVYLDVVDALFNLCGTNGALLEDVLEMSSELRDKETDYVLKPGVRKALELKYVKEKGAKSSQATYALSRLKEYNKETIKNAVEVWKGMR